MAQMEATAPPSPQPGLGATQRNDRWWIEPALVIAGLGAFIIYSTIFALIGEDFKVGPYLSPLYEPEINPGWRPDWFSPAIFILPAPLGFRATCYYYRRAYYRSFFLTPPACAVQGIAPGKYTGERGLLLIQNAHRFFMYVALVFNVMLWVGAVRSYWHDGEVGVGLGSIVLTVNAFLLMMYTFSCHSLRHFIGGGLDCFSCTSYTKVRKRSWDIVTSFNEHHRLWAWSSLIFVGCTDLYIRLVATGTINDPNTWGF